MFFEPMKLSISSIFNTILRAMIVGNISRSGVLMTSMLASRILASWSQFIKQKAYPTQGWLILQICFFSGDTLCFFSHFTYG